MTTTNVSATQHISWFNGNVPRGRRFTPHSNTHHHHHHRQGHDHHHAGLSHGNNTAPDFDQQRQNPPATQRVYSRRNNIHHHNHQGYDHSMTQGTLFVYGSSPMAVHGHDHLYSLQQGVYVPSILTHNNDPYIYGDQISNHMQNNFTRHPLEEETLVLNDFHRMIWPVEETIIVDVDEVEELFDDEEIQCLQAETISKHLKTRNYKREGDEEEGDDICVVCQDEFENNDEFATLRCGHDQYQADCINKWLLQNNVCPICRATALTVDQDC